jgi:hypothetical protein
MAHSDRILETRDIDEVIAPHLGGDNEAIAGKQTGVAALKKSPEPTD